MKEFKVGTVSFDTTISVDSPFIVGVFGPEGSGKTRLPMTGPEGVGIIPLEMKSYKTIEMVSAEYNKTVYKPKNPKDFIVNQRSLIKKSPAEIIEFYKDVVERIKDATYAMLDNNDIGIVCIDKFSTFCLFSEFAIHGPEGKMLKIEGKLYKDKRESNQNIIDFINSMSDFNKPVILTGAHAEIYKGGNPTGRNRFDGFKYIGSHCNVVVEMHCNDEWDPDSNKDSKNWHFGLSVRHCQSNKTLEGPDGDLMLKDDMVTLGNLLLMIDPETDILGWTGFEE